MQPHRRQPTRLLCPWDSPCKNTGVGCHLLPQCMKMKSKSEVAQSCPTLCDPMDCSLPGSSVHGIFQAVILEWIAISFSRGSSQLRDRTRVSCIVDRRRGVMRMGRWGKEDHRCRRKRKEKGKKMDSFCDQWYLRMAECETILRSGLCLKIE